MQRHVKTYQSKWQNQYTEEFLQGTFTLRSLEQKHKLGNSRLNLEKQLEMALLQAAAYRKMIEIAEKELKIEIRKKSDTKQ